MGSWSWFSQTGHSYWKRLKGVLVGSDGTPLPSPFKELNDHVYELYKPIGEPSMEIIFFHGLQFGNSDNAYWSTWTCGDATQQEVWPSTWLAQEFPSAHIFSISYDSSMRTTNQRGRSNLHNLAENLIACIGWARIGQAYQRPVILVGHCFGGLVIKQVCVKAHQMFSLEPDLGKKSQELGRFLNNIKGVFFYGTPHRGSHFADKAVFFLNGPLLDYVTSLSAISSRLEEQFDALSKKYKMWPTAGLGEELPTEWGPFKGVVVPEGSARYGDFGTVAADHISLCKPKKQNSNSFQHLTTFISNVLPKGETCFYNFQHGIPKEGVGLDLQVQKVQEKLQENTSVGIDGMGGIGKTTLAKAVFNKLGPAFEYTCFVPDVKLIAGDLTALGTAVWKFMCCDGKTVPNKLHRWFDLRGKRLLLVLDDVAGDRDLNFLSYIATCGAPEMQCILTSRDTELFKRSDDVLIHRMPFLSEIDAKQLFVSYAFPHHTTPPVFLGKHIDSVVNKCDGLPLTVEVLGKYLKSKENVKIWEQALEALDKAEALFKLDERLWEKLRVSYNALGEKEKQIFLDATTMFSHEDNRFNWTLREAKAGWSVTYGRELILWQTLVDMSLVYDVKEDEPIKIHEQLQSLGRKIALESNKVGKCRVWDKENKMALELLHPTRDDQECDHQEIYSFVVLGRTRDLDGFTSDGEDFFPKNLGHVLEFSKSSIQKLEKVQYLDLEVQTLVMVPGAQENEPFPIFRDLVLLRTPGLQFDHGVLFDPALLPHLTVLKLSGYSHLKSLPKSFGQLSALRILEIAHAPCLQFLPDEFGRLSQLERLTFNWCRGLSKLPETFDGLRSLEHLEFYSVDELHTLPKSFGHLFTLKHLKFHDCKNLRTLPDSFGKLSTLENLEFHVCQSLHALPTSFGHLSALEHLKLSRCRNLHTLPHSFGQLAKLEMLTIVECRQIKTLSFSAGQVGALRRLIVDFVALTSIPDFPSLRILELGILPFLQRFPPWWGDGLPTSRKIFYLQDGQISLQEESKLRKFEQLTLSSWLHGLAMDRVKELDYPGAAAVLDFDLGLESLDPEVWGFVLQERGIIKRLMGDLDGAVEDLTTALMQPRASSYSDWPEYTIDNCLRHRGFARFLMGDVEGALEDAKEELKLRPWEFGYLRSITSKPSLGEQTVTYLNCKLVGRRERQAHEQLFRSSHSWALKKVLSSDFTGALAELNVIDASILGPERSLAFFLRERGILKRLTGDLEGALADLTEALETNLRHEKNDYENNYDCWRHRGFVRYLKGDVEGAVDDAKEALKLQPWEARYVLSAKPSVGEESITYLDFKFVGMKQSNDHDGLFFWTHSWALKYVRASNFHGALARFDIIDARVLGPERRVFFLQESGILKRFIDDLEGALADLTEALEMSLRHGNDNYDCRKHRGFVKFLMGDFDGARTDAERALAIIVDKNLDDSKPRQEDINKLEERNRGSLGGDSVTFLEFKLV